MIRSTSFVREHTRVVYRFTRPVPREGPGQESERNLISVCSNAVAKRAKSGGAEIQAWSVASEQVRATRHRSLDLYACTRCEVAKTRLPAINMSCQPVILSFACQRVKAHCKFLLLPPTLLEA